MDSILTSIKKLLGITEEYTHFDTDLIIHINTVFSILNHLGVGPADGFSITSKTDKWSDFISDNTKIESVKSYIYMKVKLIFDPPLSSSVVTSMNQLISEMEWRLQVVCDPELIIEEEEEEEV